MLQVKKADVFERWVRQPSNIKYKPKKLGLGEQDIIPETA